METLEMPQYMILEDLVLLAKAGGDFFPLLLSKKTFS